MTRKTAIVIVTLLEVIVIGSLVASRVITWNTAGWTGFTFHPQRDVGEQLPEMPFFGSAGEVFFVAPNSPAGRAGVSSEDRVVAVNGIPINEKDELHRLSGQLGVGDTITYVFDRQGEEIGVDLTLESPLDSPLQLSALVTNLVAGLIWLSISFLVYWSRPDSRVAGVFFAMCASGAAMYLAWAAGELDSPGLRGILPFGSEPELFISIGLTAVFSIVMTNLVLHMALIFPKNRPIVSTWPSVFVWIHGVPFLAILALGTAIGFLFATKGPIGLMVGEVVAAVLLIFLVISLARRVTENGLWSGLKSSPFLVFGVAVILTTQVFTLLRLLPAVLFAVILGALSVVAVMWMTVIVVVFAVFAAVALYRSYQESGVELRSQVRWPLWGTFTSLVLSIVLALVALFFGVFEADFGGQAYLIQSGTNMATRLVYLLIPFSFAFAILKYRLLDIDIIIRKTVVFTVVTGFVVAVYLVLAGVFGHVLVQLMGLESQIATIGATLAVVALLVPARNVVQRVVDRRFFQRERDLEVAAARIAESILHGADPQHMLRELADGVQRALRTSSLAILTRRPGGDRLIVEVTLGLNESAVAGLSVACENPRLNGAAIIEADEVEGDLETLKKVVRGRLFAVARRDNYPSGLLVVGQPQGREDFDEDERRFLIAAADQIAVIVGRSMQRQAEGELQKARTIQRSLLPQVLPEVAGIEVAARWEPAREVSGDYYDVIRLDDHRLLICIGDVVGKGLPAALLMSTLQAAVKAVAASTDSPSMLCEQVRAVVRGSLSGGTFVTFFCAVVDRARMQVSSTNAGHNPPVLVRRSGEIIRLECGGPAMARILAEDYDREVTPLESGDRLVLFTDGVTEAMNPRSEMFGDGPFEELVAELVTASVAEAERAIAATVIAHARGVLSDDLTLVVVGIE